jgi:hypothetical protein
MPFIKEQTAISMVELRAKIEEPVSKLLEQYCAFIKSPTGYVVQEILRKAMAHDKDFQASLGNVKTNKQRKQKGIATVAQWHTRMDKASISREMRSRTTWPTKNIQCWITRQ